MTNGIVKNNGEKIDDSDPFGEQQKRHRLEEEIQQHVIDCSNYLLSCINKLH